MSATKKPRTPQEQWEAVLRQAEGPEARELEAMSDDEVDAELRAMGLDPERVAREGEALAEKAMREAGLLGAVSEPDSDSEPESEPAPARAPAPAPEAVQAQPAEVFHLPVPTPRRRPRWPLLLVAAAIAALAIGGGVLVARRDDRVPPEPTPLPDDMQPPNRERSPDVDLAIRLREDARTDLYNADLLACLAKLDHARELDPAGDATESVQRMRAEVKLLMTPRDSGPEPERDKRERKRP